MTYLGMQILIEGLALAAFQRIRDTAKNPLAAAVNAYVMQDEARHVAFGRLALRDYYPQLSDAERDEREEFVVEACYHMRDRFNQREVWETLGLPVEECIQATMQSDQMRQFRTRLFTRIVPTVKDIGLWGSRVQQGLRRHGRARAGRRRRRGAPRERQPRRSGVRRQVTPRRGLRPLPMPPPGSDCAGGARARSGTEHPCRKRGQPDARELSRASP